MGSWWMPNSDSTSWTNSNRFVTSFLADTSIWYLDWITLSDQSVGQLGQPRPAMLKGYSLPSHRRASQLVEPAA